MKALALVLVSMMLMGALAPSSIYFQDNFDSVDGWEISQGEGMALDGGTFVGEGAWFAKRFTPFDIEDLYYEVIISGLSENGTWGLSFVTTEGSRAILYEGMNEIGIYTGQIKNTVVVDGVVIEVNGEVTFDSIMVFSNLDYGNPLSEWSDFVDELMDANPWIAPTGLSIIILIVGIALIFGRKRR